MGPKQSLGLSLLLEWPSSGGRAQPPVHRFPGISLSPLLPALTAGPGRCRAHPATVPAAGCSSYCQGFSRQYNTNQRDLNVRQAWEQGYTGKGIVVSILDDGIEKNHPDLEGNYVSVGQCCRAVCHRSLSGQLRPLGAVPEPRGTGLVPAVVAHAGKRWRWDWSLPPCSAQPQGCGAQVWPQGSGTRWAR